MRDSIIRTLSAIITAVITLVGIAGCAWHPEDNGPAVTGSTKVRLSVVTPRSGAPSTRSRSNVNETDIEEIMVLVFDGSSLRYLYMAEGTIESSVNNTTTFEVNLVSSETPIILCMIANCNDLVSSGDFTPGTPQTGIQQALSMSFTSAGMSGRFPMYGRHALARLDATGSNSISGIKMIRAIARIDIDATTVSPLASDPDKRTFELEEVYVYGAYNKLSIIPSETDNDIVTAPSVPSDARSIRMIGPYPSNGYCVEETIYIPESEHHDDVITDITRIVVGGRYKGGQTTYYRIDFYPQEADMRGVVLRNHCYSFRITNVSKDGWSTPDQAADNEASGLAVTVEDWNNVTTEMWWDGDHYFGVSTREIILQYRQGSVSDLLIETSIDEPFTIQWVGEDGSPLSFAANGEDSLAEEYSLENNWFDIERAGSNREATLKVTARLQNDTYLARSSYFMISTYRWKIFITVRQLSMERNTNRTVRVISVSEVGCLGDNSGANINSAAVLRRVLDYNFYANGAVSFGGFSYTRVPAPDQATLSNNLTPAALANHDIVFMTNANQPNAATVQRVIEWLKADKRRVLVLGMDYSWTNIQFFRNPYISEDVTGLEYGISGGFDCPVVRDEEAAYFWRDGPFTTTPVAPGAVYRQSDLYWGRFTPSPESTITRVINAHDGKMTLGVDKVKRIVYVGDCQWGALQTGSEYIGKRFNRTDGNVFADSDPAKVIANIWAWMVEEVVLAD